MTRLVDADSIPWDVDGVGTIPVVTKEEIDKMPTIDVEPVRHATLLDASPIGECSMCGFFIDIRASFKYCPNCGAKMDGIEFRGELRR